MAKWSLHVDATTVVKSKSRSHCWLIAQGLASPVSRLYTKFGKILMFTTADPQQAGRRMTAGRRSNIIHWTSIAAGERRMTPLGLRLPGGPSSSSMSSLRLPKVDAAGTGEMPDDESCEPTTRPRKSAGEFNNVKLECKRAWMSDSFVLPCPATDTSPRFRLSEPTISSPDVRSRTGGNDRHVRGSVTFIKAARTSVSTRLEWMNVTKTEIYNVASTQLRSMLKPPAISLDLNGVPEGVFAGPLLEIFPDSKFPRPSRVDCAEFDEAMGVGRWRYPAEDSGASQGRMHVTIYVKSIPSRLVTVYYIY